MLVEADLSGLSGLSLVQRLRTQGFSQPLIVLSNMVNRGLRLQAVTLGATEVIEKPLVNAFLVDRLSDLFPGAAILPHPVGGSVELRAGQAVTFRVMTPDDADMVQAFVKRLSEESRFLRFFSGIDHLSPSMLDHFTHPKYPRTYALIATVTEAEQDREIGAARYEPTAVRCVAEFAVVVADDWQGRGIANQLMRGLITTAAVAGIKRLEGLVLRKNHRMLKLARSLGFTPSPFEDDSTIVRVSKNLRDPIRQSGSSPLPGEDSGRAMTGS